MKHILLYLLSFSSLFSLTCTGYIDDNTSLYDYRCGAEMLNMNATDYSSIMALLGGLTGLIFLSSVIYLIFKIGKSYRV